MIWEHAVGIELGPFQRDHGIAFVGNNGTLVVDRGGWELYPESRLEDGRAVGYKMPGRPRVAARPGEAGLDQHTRNFIECMKSREQPVCNTAVGSLAAVNAHLGNIAFRTGAKVDWDPEALLSVLSVPALAGSTLPAADAAEAILGERGGRIITVLSIVSLPPLLNAIMMIGSRVLFAMGRDGLVWRGTAAVNAGGTPGVAMLVTTAVAIVFIMSATFEQLVAVASFFLAANYVVSCLALIVLRRSEPDLPRPFRAWGYPWSVRIVLAGATVFLAGVLLGDTPRSLVAFGLLAIGFAGRAMWSRRSA